MVGTRESVINTCVITTSRKKRIINIHREQDIGNNMRNKCDNFPCGMSSKERTSEASLSAEGRAGELDAEGRADELDAEGRADELDFNTPPQA
ncbi:MAG: hypothetical protein EOP33_09505 [Rickettsiaceae bacterium]|nr:MAG: hypothetical protein EOP33_09505 [Rickettsiaceae bacterium]